MSADALIENAKVLRTEKKYAEAILAAREATRASPDNADAWWQLGLATEFGQGLGKALAAFEKTTELAPHFGSGWLRLGMAQVAVGTEDAAKVSLHLAFELDPDLELALDKLADLSEQSNDAAEELWALEHLAERNNLSSYQCNRLGILYHNRSAHALAIHFYRRCAKEADDPAGWINLGLALADPAVSQDADAIDVLRHGQLLYPDRDRFKTLLDSLLPKALKLSEYVRARETTVLSADEQYQHYVSPIELLNLDNEQIDALGPKEIQRAKRRLLQEIDLEDGKLSWMQGLTIDRSRALALSEEIASNQNFLHHHVRVYRDKRLLEFLSRGALDHFLVTAYDDHREAQEAFEDNQDSFAEWLSPIFAAQYSLVLSKMANQTDLRMVECLLDGRRWVGPQHDEECFEATKRIIDRLIEGLDETRRLAESEKAEPPQIEAALAKGGLGILLEMLPNHFNEELSKTFHFIRGVSIDTNNEHDDPELAISILEIGRSLAMKSANLRQSFEEDLKKLQDLKAEADKQSAKLIMGGKPLEITKDGAKFGERFIPAHEVTSLRWGAIANAGGRPGMAKYVVVVGADRGPEINIEWTTQETKEQDDYFNQLTYASLLHLMTPCIENLQKELDAGQRIRIGCTVATKAGLEIKIKGFFFEKNHVIDWSVISTEMKYGVLTFSDPSNRKAKVDMSMIDTDNAVTLHWLIKLRGKS